MRWLALGCFLLTCCAGRSTAQILQDPGGWSKARWGMTANELRTAFPEAVVAGPVLAIPECEIDGERVHITFEVDAQAGLRRIRIEPDEKSSVDPTLDVPPPTVARIGEILLLAGLKEQFGEPREATTEPSFDETGQVTHQWRWGFPSTSVVLVWKAYASPDYHDLDRTYLVYEKRSAETAY
jgi:hypothetical protein